MITTRVKPTSCRVVVDGVDVRAQPVAVKRRIAVVPQLSNLDRSLTALENLTSTPPTSARRGASGARQALEILERFGLSGRANDSVNDFSGGMAQPLMIARALMHHRGCSSSTSPPRA